MVKQLVKLLILLLILSFQLQLSSQQDQEEQQQEIAEQLEEIAQRDAEKQEKYQQYRDRINQRYENHEDEVEEAEEYENPTQVLDKIFEDAIEENHRIRIGLEKEQVSSEEQEKIKEDDIHILITNEIFIKAWHNIYKEKLNQLISNDTIAKQMNLVNEARYYLLGEISTTSVNITGEIKSISSSQCEDSNCDECFHYTPSKCKLCNNGYALTENLTCTDTCSSGYYMEKIHDVVLCIKCNPICKECSKTETQCVSCFPNRLLENQTCVTTCSVGYYLQEKQCLKCSGNNFCETYNQNSCNCISCAEGFILQDSKCLSECESIEFCINYNENCECTECKSGYFANPNTQICQPYPKDCAEYKELMGPHFKDGIYPIYLQAYDWTFNVYCEDVWIILLRRIDSNQSFYQNWTVYAQGFGELDDAFWLGLEKMHALTAEPKTMRVDLWYHEEYAYAGYYGFNIGDSSTDYALNYYYFAGGNAGDSFFYHKGQKFSTYDQENDHHPEKCTYYHPNGWWYNACLRVNLNAPYWDHRYYRGILYTSYKGYGTQMTKAIMKIK